MLTSVSMGILSQQKELLESKSLASALVALSAKNHVIVKSISCKKECNFKITVLYFMCFLFSLEIGFLPSARFLFCLGEKFRGESLIWCS